MSIQDGLPVNASVTNAAFISRTDTSTSTASILQLLNPTTPSGPTIPNTQAALNQVVPSVFSTQTIANAGEFVFVNQDTQGNNIIPVVGDANPVVMSATPMGIYTGPSGSVFIITGTDDTNTVTLIDSDVDYGLRLNGNATLSNFETLIVYWDLANLRFRELSRSF